MQFTTLFFDLDDTLYPSGNGLWEAIRERMNEYMGERLGFSAAEIPGLRHEYFVTYGTTLRGLQLHHQVDADDFLAYVHDLPIEQMVQPDPPLRALVASLPQRKFIFTNADRNHARRVLNCLGMNGCFEAIIDIHAMGFNCKPDPRAYKIAMDCAGESDPSQCVYLDDSTRNLAPARQIGMYTVLVGSQDGHAAAFRAVPSPHALPQVMPELWHSPPPKPRGA